MIQPKDRFQRNQLFLIHLKDLLPDNHLLLKVDPFVHDDMIYQKLESYYPKSGRTSIAPHELIRALMLMYIYEKERYSDFAAEFAINIAYKWFVGLNIMEKITPRQMTYNVNRFEKGLLSDVLEQSLEPIINAGLVELRLYPSVRLSHLLEKSHEPSTL